MSRGKEGEGRRTQGRRKDRGEGERQVVTQTFRKHKRKRREEEDRRAEAEGHILEGSINHGSAFTVVLNIKLNIVFMSHEKRSTGHAALRDGCHVVLYIPK